jgi:hypothetical protein
MYRYLKSSCFRLSTVAAEDIRVPELPAWASDVLGKTLAPSCRKNGHRGSGHGTGPFGPRQGGGDAGRVAAPTRLVPIAASLFAQVEDQIAGYSRMSARAAPAKIHLLLTLVLVTR